jgi:uncharacterized iron-regulated protein
MTSRVRHLLLGLAALACVAAVPSGFPGPWQSAHHRDHPLVGTIQETATGRTVSPDALIARLAARRYVLLGEKHDNPDHHRLQAWIVEALVAAGRRPALAFEMFRADQADAIARHLATAPADASGLGDAVEWKRSGWPPWTMYAPIADVAVRARLPIVAANLAERAVGSLRRGGVAALEPAMAAKLGLDQPIPDDVRQRLNADIRDGHCGKLPERSLEPFVLVQRARDEHMAAALRDAGADGAVLIAGANHVRRDVGVPRPLPAADTASVAFLEVAPGSSGPPEPRVFDYAWFTPRVDDRDPCDRFRESLERLRQAPPPAKD